MSPRVLIVEDEEPLTLLLRYNLEAEGYEVDSVARGDEAEIRMREQMPDIVLLDWMLPGLSGIELCRRIRVRPETERLPVIMLTANALDEHVRASHDAGADQHLSKPIRATALIEAIVEAIASSEAAAERRAVGAA